MAETATPHHTVGARIQVSDLVPDGRSMVEVETDSETVICVRRGEMSDRLVRELNGHFAHATRTGRWIRPDTDDQPPGHPQD